MKIKPEKAIQSKKVDFEKVKPQDDPVEELPNLNDKDVQDATLKIQKAYMKKIDKSKDVPKVQNTKPQEKKPQEIQQEKVDEELPDLQDAGVQNATMAIQKVYRKKKQVKPVEKPTTPIEEKSKEDPKKAIESQEESMTNAFPVQNGYITKKNGKFVQVRTGSKPSETKKVETQEAKIDSEEELPDLNDLGVQNATKAIQKAYIKKKGRHLAKANNNVKPPVQEEQKKEYDEEMPNLQDPNVQKATLKIQNAYIKKKARVSHPNDKKAETQVKNKAEEKNEELPNLQDVDVQKATFTIQKAYKKKKVRDNKVEPTKKDLEEPKNHKNDIDKEEELPNLADPEVQNATLAIQKAYMKKKARKPANIGHDQAPVKKEVIADKVEKKQNKEEEEELPNLKDPEVQNATLVIQNAYKKRKEKLSSKI